MQNLIIPYVDQLNFCYSIPHLNCYETISCLPSPLLILHKLKILIMHVLNYDELIYLAHQKAGNIMNRKNISTSGLYFVF